MIDHAWVTEEAKSYDLIEDVQKELEMAEKMLKNKQNVEWKGN